MLLNSALLLLRERPSVLKGLWAIYLERETKSFSPFLLLWSYKWQLFEKQSWRGPNLFRSSRKKAWALTLGLWGRRSSTRDSAILIRELDEALQKTSSLSKLFNPFFSSSIQWMLDEKWMNVTDYRMHEWICVPVPLFHLYISTFLLAYNSFHFLKECSNLFTLYMYSVFNYIFPWGKPNFSKWVLNPFIIKPRKSLQENCLISLLFD